MFHSDQQRTGLTQDPTIGASDASHLTVRWKARATQSKLFVSSPAVAFNTDWGKPLVYSATVSGTITARDLATGAVVWASTGNGPIESSPAVVDNTVYIGTESDRLLALNATDGDLECSFSASGEIIGSPVVGDVDGTGPVVFFGDDGASEAMNAGHEWAVNGVGNTDGACTQRWAFDDWKSRGASGDRTGSWSPPALATDSTGRPLLVFGSSDPDDAVYALDARTGQLVWRFQTKITDADADVGAAPTIGRPGLNGFPHGVVYIDGKDKIEYAIDLLTGTGIWKVNLANRAAILGVDALSTAALVGNRIIVPYARYLFSLNAKTGVQAWRSTRANGFYFSSPAVSGAPGAQVIIIGDTSGEERAYRLNDGTQTFELKTAGAIYSSAAVAFGTVLFGANDGYLYALS